MRPIGGVLGLDGRVAIVTGAARGIGRAICVALDRAGCAVVAIDVVRLEDSTARCRQRVKEGLR